MPKNTSIYTQICPQVLQNLKNKYNNYNNTPFSFIEISHRSQSYLNLNKCTLKKLTKYFNAEDYACILMPSGVAISSISFNLSQQQYQYYFYVTGHMSDNNYKEMCKYNNKTKKLTSIQDISMVYQYVMENKCRVIVHVNMVDDGKVIQLPLLPASISHYVTVIKNINYCFPWAQQRRIQADIAYFESQTGLSTPGFVITFIKSSLITQLPQKPSCPDMFSYQLHHSQKSIINTPFTLCTFVLHQNIEYNLRNRQQILHTLHNNKKYFKTKSQEYRKNRSYAQTEDDRQQAETMAIVKLDKLAEQNKKQIMDNNYGWKINQDTYCFYIQPENTNFINFIHK